MALPRKNASISASSASNCMFTNIARLSIIYQDCKAAHSANHTATGVVAVLFGKGLVGI
jgi:hypothetical protein